MKCSKCGSIIVEGTKFCGKCGKPITGETDSYFSPDVKQISRKPLPIKKIVLISGSIVIFLIASAFFLNRMRLSNYNKISDKYFMVFHYDEEKVEVRFSNGKSEYFSGKKIGPSYSILKDKGVFVLQSQNLDSKEDVKTYYYISNNKAKPFAQTSTNSAVDYIISSKGDVVFLSDTNTGGNYGEGTLSIYNGEKTQIISDVFFANGNFCVSPDGTHVVYTADFDAKQQSSTTYIWSNGKSTPLGENLTPVAVSNGGKLVYYLDDKNLIVRSEKDKVRLTKESTPLRMFFNSDNSSVIYNDANKTYISNNGGAKLSLDGGLMGQLLTDHVYPESYNSLDTMISMSGGVKNFNNTFYETETGIYRINKKHESERVIKKPAVRNSDFFLADDGKTILYHFGPSDIYKIDGMKEDPQAEKIVEEEVRYFESSSDGSVLYYVNGDGELYYQKGKGKPILVDDSINSKEQQFDIFERDNKVFYIKDSELYSAKFGGRGSRVKGVDSDNITSVFANNFYVAARAKNSINYSINYSFDGKTFIER